MTIDQLIKLTQYVQAQAVAADANVYSVSINPNPFYVITSGMTKVTRPDGLVVVLFTPQDTNASAAAVTAITNLDVSAAAVQAWLDGQTPDKTTLRNATTQMIADINSYLAAADTGTAAQIQTRDHTAVRGLALDMKRVLNYLLTQVS